MSKKYHIEIRPRRNLAGFLLPVRVQRVKGLMLVTYNGADMSKFAPPHSFINAMDFKSVSALAKYMIQVIILKQGGKLSMK